MADKSNLARNNVVTARRERTYYDVPFVNLPRIGPPDGAPQSQQLPCLPGVQCRVANPGYDVDKAINNMAACLHPPFGERRCARHVINGLKAADIHVVGADAKDLGPNLIDAGFEATELTYQQAQRGDVAVIQGFGKNPFGHTAIYTGSQWMSDFAQTSFWPSRAYQAAQPSYVIYRYGR